MPPKSKPAERLPPPAPVVNSSRGKGSWRYASKSEGLVKPIGPVPAPNSFETLQSSEADIPPDPVDGIVANVGNVISEDNILGRKYPRHINSNPVTTGKADRATPDSNSFAALLSPEANTLHTLSEDSSKSEVNPSVEPVLGSNLSEGVWSPWVNFALLWTAVVVSSACLPAILGYQKMSSWLRCPLAPPPLASLLSLEAPVRLDVCWLRRPKSWRIRTLGLP
ncbi:hypothetical protein Nepgr_008012 [Nepenthes gracilis]|uniref:Uncharacterized protein n=1 Tax=Nepenthes gracilis TaxID=150966 RepID=A0AAD3S7Y3_NEPGR|nr:hypothetical protein Nepgr_008012 [Nepenthes gracilis]